MLTTFLIVFEQMIRILLLMAVGFALNRLNLIPKAAGQVLSRLVTLLFLPALVLHTYMVECRVDSLAANSVVVLFGLGFCIVSVCLSLVLARPFGEGDPARTGVYRYAVTVPNTGAVATPLVLALSGTAGLFQQNLYLFFTIIVTYSWGIMQLLPRETRGGRWDGLRRVITPTFVATVAGLALGVLGAAKWMPVSVLAAVESLSDCYVPISLLLVGFSVGNYPLRQALGTGKVRLFVLLRLLVIPGVFLLALRLIGAPDIVCLITVLVYACPCGMNVVVYPMSHGLDCREGVSMVLLSNLGSIVTVPLMYALASL